MENKELEKWLEETKAKNLSQWELQKEIEIIMDKGFLMQLQGSNSYTKASILHNKWANEKANSPIKQDIYKPLIDDRGTPPKGDDYNKNKEKEFSPKRGDRVLVFDGNEYDIEAIFLTKIEGAENPICTVDILTENEFLNNKPFYITCYKHMKPLLTEPKETDFKSQVIELIEKTIREYGEAKEVAVSECDYGDAAKYILIKETFEVFLKVVKEQLC